MVTIGQQTWYAGDLVTITSDPYMLYGGEFQDAVTEDGRTVTIATARFKQAEAERKQAEWHEQQAAFSRLNRGASDNLADLAGELLDEFFSGDSWPRFYGVVVRDSLND